MKLLDILKPSAEYLDKSGIDDSLDDAEMIVFHAAGTNRLAAYRDNPEIGDRIISRINKLLDRRARGEPVQYIVGYINFLGLKIKVGKGILIPRPETEILAHEAIKTVRSKESGDRSNNSNASPLTPHPLLSVLDLCTGSGCISLAVAKEFPAAKIYGTDISAAAIRYAKKNAELNGIKNVVFLKGSLFRPLKKSIKFDIIISNPPYIKTSDIQALQREIKDWEPIEALDGGVDGMKFYRKIFSEAGTYLKNQGKIMLEIGFDQAKGLKEVAKKSGFKKVSLIKDFAGIERILKAES